MKTKFIIYTAALCGASILSSCKDSPSTRSGDADQGASQAPEPVEAVAPADAAHVLYSEKSLLPLGSRLIETSNNSIEGGDLSVTIRGQTIKGSSQRTTEREVSTTVISESEDLREVVKHDVSSSMTMGGRAVPQPSEPPALLGKKIKMVRGDNQKWTASMIDGEPDEKQTKALTKLVKNYNTRDEAHIYGTEPRKVGDSWDVDVSKLEGFTANGQKPTGSLKVSFVGIAKHQGLDCAVLEADIDIKGKIEGEGEELMDMASVGKIRIIHSLKYKVSLISKMDGSMTLKGKVNQGQADLTMKAKHILTERTTIKLPK